MNFQGQDLPVFKANLHTHTTLSDGKFSAAEVVTLYREAGYDVLAFTDHWKTNPVSSYEAQGMTLLSGMELHPGGPRNITWHFLALGLPEDRGDELVVERLGRVHAAVADALVAGARAGQSLQPAL